MAAPIIDSVSPGTSIVFSPGQTINVTINAHDPDSGAPVSQVFNVADSTGNVTPVTVTLQVQDALTFSAGAPPAGWTVSKIGNNVFAVKAP